MWLVRQNMKGVCVPSKLLLKHYYQLWPMGPHSQCVQHHLDQMKNPHTKKRWLTRFRRSWGFSYSKLPSAAPMTKEEIDRKVNTVDPYGKCSLRFFGAIDRDTGARIGTIFGPKIVPPFRSRTVLLIQRRHRRSTGQVLRPKKWYQIWYEKKPHVFFQGPRLGECKIWPKIEAKLGPEMKQRNREAEACHRFTNVRVGGFGDDMGCVLARSRLLSRQGKLDQHRRNSHPLSCRRPGRKSTSRSYKKS